MFGSFTHHVFEHKSHNLDPVVGNGVVFNHKGVSTHGKVITRTGQRIRVEVDGGCATVWSEVKEVTAVKTAEHHSHHDLDASGEAAAAAAAAGKVKMARRGPGKRGRCRGIVSSIVPGEAWVGRPSGLRTCSTVFMGNGLCSAFKLRSISAPFCCAHPAWPVYCCLPCHYNVFE